MTTAQSNEVRQNTLKKLYLVTKYDYETGRQATVEVCIGKPNADAAIQDHATMYIQKVDGRDGFASLDERLLSATKLGDNWTAVTKQLLTMSNGHYVIIDANDHLSKWTVVRKYLVLEKKSGYWSTSQALTPKVTKVFDLDVTEMPIAMFQQAVGMYKNRTRALCGNENDDLISAARSAWGEFTQQFASGEVMPLLAERCPVETPAVAASEPALGLLAGLQKNLPHCFAKYPRRINFDKKTDKNTSPMYGTLLNDIEAISLPEPKPTQGTSIKQTNISRIHKQLAKEVTDVIKKRTGKPAKKSGANKEESWW